jgi:hypothetical protein
MRKSPKIGRQCRNDDSDERDFDSQDESWYERDEPFDRDGTRWKMTEGKFDDFRPLRDRRKRYKPPSPFLDEDFYEEPHFGDAHGGVNRSFTAPVSGYPSQYSYGFSPSIDCSRTFEASFVSRGWKEQRGSLFEPGTSQRRSSRHVASDRRWDGNGPRRDSEKYRYVSDNDGYNSYVPSVSEDAAYLSDDGWYDHELRSKTHRLDRRQHKAQESSRQHRVPETRSSSPPSRLCSFCDPSSAQLASCKSKRQFVFSIRIHEEERELGRVYACVRDEPSLKAFEKRILQKTVPQCWMRSDGAVIVGAEAN